MFEFIKKVFIAAMNPIPLNFFSMINQECKKIPTMVNIKSNEPLFYPCSTLAINVVAAAMILMTHGIN